MAARLIGPSLYKRRRPDRTLIYQVLNDSWQEFQRQRAIADKQLPGPQAVANPWQENVKSTPILHDYLPNIMLSLSMDEVQNAFMLLTRLVLLLILLLIRTSFLDGFGEALSFLFSINQGELTPHGLMEAVGHSFFTLSLGMGAMITYGSYLSSRENIVRAAFSVAILDTTIALLAGVVIFSIVFSFGLEPSSGPGLIFATLPVLFAQLPGGTVIATTFFLAVFFAALTSAVSLLEVVVAYWTESHKVNRTKGTILSSIAIFALGLLSVLSTNSLSEFKVLGLTFFDFFDKLTSSYMLPLGGVLISLFFGWRVANAAVFEDLKLDALPRLGLLWITRVFAPIAIIIVLWNLLI